MSREKFKALVHFIVHECRDNPGRLGAVRLNKALWFIDMLTYQRDGVSVSGEKYIKREKGPVPATILATLRELSKEEKILIQEPGHKYDSRKFISLREPENKLLSPDECQIARQATGFVCDRTANEISDLTHEEVWDAAAEGEEIPLFATLATGKGPVTDKVRKWAEEVVEEIEKAAA